MAWTAQITNKRRQDDVYYVTVEYADGINTHTETYKSRNPSAEWIPDTVANRIPQLEALYSFDVSIGPVTPTPDTTDPSLSVFMNRVRLLPAIQVMIDLGVIQADNAKVVQLVNWIKANFNTYFDQM